MGRVQCVVPHALGLQLGRDIANNAVKKIHHALVRGSAVEKIPHPTGRREFSLPLEVHARELDGFVGDVEV